MGIWNNTLQLKLSNKISIYAPTTESKKQSFACLSGHITAISPLPRDNHVLTIKAHTTLGIH